MNAPACREKEALRQQIAAHERELDHRANVISTQADTIARLTRELADRGQALPARTLSGAASTCFPSPEDNGWNGY